MSKFAVLWLFCALVAGALLFQTSQQVTDDRARLERLAADLRREEDALRVLQAEWSYLNQPDRLEKLAAQYLKLAPMKGRQFAAVADLPLRPLPAEETEETLVAARFDTVLEELAPAAGPGASVIVSIPLRKPAGLRLPATFTPATAAAPAATTAPPQKAPAKTAPAPVSADAGAAARRSFGDVLDSLGTGGAP